ncbi:hypothetical protein [Brevundimonas sp. LjRoot202]|uniref:hypothetical protein n=1 Tax=Brevundimonas sp. LjRoot202 TaxID=3342281 RepID=UPI003ED074DC
MTSEDEVTLQRLIGDAQEVADRSPVTFLPFERLDEGFRIIAFHGDRDGKDERRDQEFVYLSDVIERASGGNLLIESVYRIEAGVIQERTPQSHLWVRKPSLDG